MLLHKVQQENVLDFKKESTILPREGKDTFQTLLQDKQEKLGKLENNSVAESKTDPKADSKTDPRADSKTEVKSGFNNHGNNADDKVSNSKEVSKFLVLDKAIKEDGKSLKNSRGIGLKNLTSRDSDKDLKDVKNIVKDGFIHQEALVSKKTQPKNIKEALSQLKDKEEPKNLNSISFLKAQKKEESKENLESLSKSLKDGVIPSILLENKEVKSKDHKDVKLKEGLNLKELSLQSDAPKELPSKKMLIDVKDNRSIEDFKTTLKSIKTSVPKNEKVEQKQNKFNLAETESLTSKSNAYNESLALKKDGLIDIKLDGSSTLKLSNLGNPSESLLQLEQKMENHGFAQMAHSASFLLNNKQKGEINLILKPESLGKVMIKLEIEEGQLLAKIVVESSEVKNFFEKNQQELLRQFKEESFSNIKLDVSLGQDQQGSQQNAQKEAQSFQGPIALLEEDNESLEIEQSLERDGVFYKEGSLSLVV